MSVSTEFTCPCGKAKAWITQDEELPNPCPNCGRRFKGKYNPETLTIDAVVIEGSEPVFVEVILEGTPEMVIRADIETVPASELAAAIEQYKATKECPCKTKRRFIFDVPGGLYDQRFCSVCRRSLGFL